MKLILPRIMQCRVIFEPRDLWRGVFWDLKGKMINGYRWWQVLHVYITNIPTLPLFIEIWLPTSNGEEERGEK